ncbi:MAG: thiolase family protein [Steroidobacterales bacterium]
MPTTDPIVILAARRTALGGLQGALAPASAPRLGSAAIRAALEDSRVPADAVDQVIMGCVLSAGLGQAPARQAGLGAGIPQDKPALTINKMCGSGMEAVMIAANQILAGAASVVVAGGMESMSNAPYLLPKARSGYRLGHQEVLDGMFFDGLQSPWDGKLMGTFADATAAEYGFTRAAQDEFGGESLRRARRAIESGAFTREITPCTVPARKSTVSIERDEIPHTLSADKIPTLKPAFTANGTVTAASSSCIADGAAALVVTRQSVATARDLKPLARIVSCAHHAREPEWFTVAPVDAIRKALAEAGWLAGEVDLYEINEAFAVVTMAAIRDLGLDRAKVNVNGGACALGHPIGASGARILATLIHALAARGQKRGIAALCIAGGEATAIALEVL